MGIGLPRSAAGVGAGAYHGGMSHPGDGLNNTCPRVWGEPVLVLEDRRSIVAWWPDTAVCEKCGAGKTPAGGYVGPVAGDAVVYPDPETRFVCKTCARSMVGLGEAELTGHQCGQCPSDTMHIEHKSYVRGELEPLAEDERIAYAMEKERYAARGWAVVDVQLPPPSAGLPAVFGTWWTVYIHAARDVGQGAPASRR